MSSPPIANVFICWWYTLESEVQRLPEVSERRDELSVCWAGELVPPWNGGAAHVSIFLT